MFGTGVLAALDLALCGEDLEEARAEFERHRDRLGHAQRMEGHYLLWRATGDPGELETAQRLLDDLVAHAPPEYRERMVRMVALHRRIRSCDPAISPETGPGESA
jgi:hypothetical protein